MLFSSSASALAIRLGTGPWHSRLTHKSASYGSVNSWLHTIVRFRYGPPVCSPPRLTGPVELCVSIGPRWLSTSQLAGLGSPRVQWDMLRAKLRIAPAGLPPASSAARLAARAHITCFPMRCRPSPHSRWVGFHMTLFEACSAFTHVPTCMVAELPNSSPLTPQCFKPCRYPHDPPQLLPPEAITSWAAPVPARKTRLSTAHVETQVGWT